MSIVKRIEIIDIDTRKSKKGNDFRVCQCILHIPFPDGTVKKRVGEYLCFDKELPLSEGSFHAEFEVDVNFEKQVHAKIVRLVPVQEVSEPKPGKGGKGEPF